MPSFYKKSIVLFDKNLAECRFSIIVEVGSERLSV